MSGEGLREGLEAASAEGPAALLRRLEAVGALDFSEFLFCVEKLQLEQAPGRAGRDVLAFLGHAVDDLRGEEAAEAMEVILRPFQTKQARMDAGVAPDRAAYEGCVAVLELLPKLAARAEAGDPEDGGFSHAELAASVVARLTAAEWPPGCAVGILQVLRDFSLDPDDLIRVAERVLLELRRVAPEEIPSLVYQLLLLSAHGKQPEILAGICDFFDQLHARIQDPADASCRGAEEAASERLRLYDITGTTLHHFEFAAQQDPQLAASFIKLVEHPPDDTRDAWECFGAFKAAALLCLMRSASRDKVLALIRKLVLDLHGHAARVAGSSWLQSVGYLRRAAASRRKLRKGHTAAPPAEDAHMTTVLLEVVRMSSRWEHLSPALLNLGLVLVDCEKGPGPGAALQLTAGGGRRGRRPTTTPAQRSACALGQALLVEAYEQHPLLRKALSEAMLCRLLTRAPNCHVYLTLLGTLSAQCPDLLLEDLVLGDVRDMLGSVCLLPPQTAGQLLRASRGLASMRPSLQDHLMLPLRKGLFSRDADARIVATRGLLLLAELGAAPDGGHSVGVPVEESMGLLRRCFQQQYPIREAYYAGLVRVHAVCPALQEEILGMLMAHLQRYFAEPGANPPVRLGACFQTHSTVVAEPLHALVASVTAILQSTPDGASSRKDDGEENAFAAAAALLDLGFALADLDLSDLELDRSVTFTRGTDDGRRNVGRAELLLPLLEVFMDVLVRMPEGASQGRGAGERIQSLSCERILGVRKLFRLRRSLLARFGASPPGSEGGGKRKKSDKSKEDFRSITDRRACIGPEAAATLLSLMRRDAEVVDADAALMERQSISEGVLGVLRDTQAEPQFLAFVLDTMASHVTLLRDGVDPSLLVYGNAAPTLQQYAGWAGGEAEAGARRRTRLQGHATQLLRRYLQLRGGQLGAGAATPTEPTPLPTQGPGAGGRGGPHATLQILSDALEALAGDAELPLSARLGHVHDIFSGAWPLAETAEDEDVRGDNIRPYLEQLLHLLTDLLVTEEAAAMREGEALLRICRFLLDLVGQQDRGALASQLQTFLAENSVCSAGLAAALTGLFVDASGGSGASNLDFLKHLALAVGHHVGIGDEEATILTVSGGRGPLRAAPHALPGLMEGAAGNPTRVADAVLGCVDRVLDDVEYLVKQRKAAGKRTTKPLSSPDDSQDPEYVASLDPLEAMLCTRLLKALVPVNALSLARLPGRACERLAGVLRRVFKLVTAMVKHEVGRRDAEISPAFAQLLDGVTRKLAVDMDAFLLHMEQNEGGKTTKQKLSRELKLIPALIFETEQLDVHLLKLLKKTKGAALSGSRWLKRRRARDFRFKGKENAPNKKARAEEKQEG